ncbi:MAG: saccharopine dehydrogenase [Segetibacter sp.]|jgi:saccharopine dehydrogenase-like NADP-dependent oxidoreductase|nr:saccharopine dehydrogenase [Segetibacter sp.]
MKQILLFGAGKSATVLIEYLKELTVEKQWNAVVADQDLSAVQAKVGLHDRVAGVQANVSDEDERESFIKTVDVVISLLPPALHYLVALSCLKFNKHLLTASYVDEDIQKLEPEIKQKGLLFLCEMGLDPGIDHMSAMQLIDRIHAHGGTITSFSSHCGGLIAPESDTNPWHYKISWNPKNVVNAGRSGAVYKKDNEVINVAYEKLFNNQNLVTVPGYELMSYYPNRDSLSYISKYGLEEAQTFIRTTLRHPDFCFGWKNIVDLKLTDQTVVYDTTNMTIANFFKIHFDKHGFSEWLNEMLHTRLSVAKDLMENLLSLMEAEEVAKEEEGFDEESIMLVNEKGELNSVEIDAVKDQAAATLALKMHEANISLKQLFFLGLDSDEILNIGVATPAQILQNVLEKKLVLQPGDKDLVLMMHEIEYFKDEVKSTVTSTLKLTGEDQAHTAMAKTVGLPLGIAARLLLENKITEKGLVIPIKESIYKLVLPELEKYGIRFEERLR